ncbi:variant erythrocyte surface antigen beta subunit, putative [Babesia ovis]|uniref:Variant erythrocyte surface antigen beta subunit, putative n=1 Tax=Babesia ovis TaxID=5869 RepID=A0A9W5WWH5_BABOV|nr:variant erythrocyte surface antigen beta subunit, putative [Babesia ovis]
MEYILQAGNMNGKNGVPIHDLYSNSLFEFRFPMSETESYYLLQDCLVALYYQMYFLKQQCNWIRQDTSGDGFGWAFCRYGDQVNGTGCGSWICPQAKAASDTSGGQNDYSGTLKKHTGQCGQNGNMSPLQAFLTDCLPGFTCEKVKANMEKYCKEQCDITKKYSDCYPDFLKHRDHAGYGQYCPIPMGFSGSFKKSKGASGTSGVGMSGLGLNAICAHYANDDLTDSCLYQLTRCICSLTRRVPRSTGTLYGFFQGIISVYGGSGGGATEKFKKALDVELQLATFGLGSGTSGSGTGTSGLMTAVMDWKGKAHESKCETLDSLSSCGGADQGGNTCGKYLHPISGSLYNSVATQYTDTYLSWIIHLTGVLQSGLESLLVEFTRISCKDCKKNPDSSTTGTGGGSPLPPSGCQSTCTGGPNGQHGEKDKGCSCHNLVIWIQYP